MEDSDDIGTLLHLASSSLDKHSDEVLRARLGIGLSQFRVLLTLLVDDGQSQVIISENLEQSEASIARQIKILQAKKLVENRKNPASKKEKLIFLSGKGIMVGQSALSILNSYHMPLFSDISEEDQAALKSILKRLQRHLDRI